MDKFIDLKRVREIINEHIRLTVGEIEEGEPKITFAVREEWGLPPANGRVVWRINIEYTPKPKKPDEFSFTRTALFMIDAETGDVLEFKEGYYWTS